MDILIGITEKNYFDKKIEKRGDKSSEKSNIMYERQPKIDLKKGIGSNSSLIK